VKRSFAKQLNAMAKAPTGIVGLDEITGGGLPRGSATLIEGQAGSGKTVLALQTLVNGARQLQEPGIFVAFEESTPRIIANAESLGWNLPALQRKKLFFLDAQPRSDLIQSGGFDLGGMLAALELKVREMGARRIVFDAVDIVLALLRDPLAERREMYRLHEWLQARGLTALITAKLDSQGMVQTPLSFMQFMVDCSLILRHDVVQGVSQRNLRVVKYRGSAFAENESPFLIGDGGLEVAGPRKLSWAAAPVTTERVSSGVARLDTMLGGGYYRGASVLITGFPGTAKSTLAGAFAAAACQRGEPTLFVSFDSDAQEVVRNLASVRIRLGGYVKRGRLRLISVRTTTGSAENHLMRIKQIVRELRARCVVIDPVSALSKAGNEGTAHSVAERLIDWSKSEGITLLCTSLLDEAGAQIEGTPLQISTIADTWIHLSYLVHAGERNRGLSIIKSRGTAHSNQVRELILSDAGVTLADAYTAGGEVLMGTLRWEKERAARAARAETETLADQKQAALQAEEAELRARIERLQQELTGKRAERQAQGRAAAKRAAERTQGRARLGELRGVDEP
jgi:circadian clock protein KaiC